MNVFVTGGAGYIGSVCVEELLNAGHSVTVFDNLTEGHRSAVDKRARFILGDFNDRDLIHSTLKSVAPEAVIHFAANAMPPLPPVSTSSSSAPPAPPMARRIASRWMNRSRSAPSIRTASPS